MATRLGARRVNDSLRLLGVSIKQARAAAAAMSAGRIVAVRTQDIPKIPLPQVKSIAWERSGTPTLVLPADPDERIIIKGDHLEDVTDFKLVGASVEFEIDLNRTTHRIEATLAGPNLSPGTYAARVTNDRGRTATLLDAVVVEAPAPEEEEEAAPLELGELLPNHARDEVVFPAALVVLEGEPDHFYFTDPWNNVVDGMTAERVERDEVHRDYRFWLAQTEPDLEQIHQGSRVIYLKITIPRITDLPGREAPDWITTLKKGERMLGFQFVAQSTRDGSEDRLTFTVVAGK